LVSASAASFDLTPAVKQGNVTQVTPGGTVTFIPYNSVILHSRVLLWGNLNTIQGTFK